jgi:hypothetical protein
VLCIRLIFAIWHTILPYVTRPLKLYRGWVPSVFCVLGEYSGHQRPTKVFVGVPRFAQQLRKNISKAAAPGFCSLRKRASEF